MRTFSHHEDASIINCKFFLNKWKKFQQRNRSYKNETGTLILCSRNSKTPQPLWATTWQLFQMLNTEVPRGFPGAQTLKNLPATWETWVQCVGWEDPPEEGMTTHSSTVAWRIPMDRGAWWAIVHGVTRSWTWLSDQAQHSTQWFPMTQKSCVSKRNEVMSKIGDKAIWCKSGNYRHYFTK